MCCEYEGHLFIYLFIYIYNNEKIKLSGGGRYKRENLWASWKRRGRKRRVRRPQERRRHPEASDFPVSVRNPWFKVVDDRGL